MASHYLRQIGLGALFIFSFAIPGAAFADARQEVISLVKKAVAFHKANGKDKLLGELNQPAGQFRKGEVYVFAYDFNGVVMAHPTNPKLVGKNLLNVGDSHGKLFRKEIVEGAKDKGNGWVDYKYTNPETKKVEDKTTYFEKSDDLVLACGIYK